MKPSLPSMSSAPGATFAISSFTELQRAASPLTSKVWGSFHLASPPADPAHLWDYVYAQAGTDPKHM